MDASSKIAPAGQASALWMSTIAFTACFAVWTIFSIIGIQIQKQLGLNETEFGLLARIATLAAENNLSAGEFATHSIGRFVNGASDEEWLALIGQMSRAENPGQVFLRHALSNAWLLSQRA